MTLLLTCLSPKWVVQVSDVRITYPQPRGREDVARKCIFYEAPDARMTIAYTGLATLWSVSRGTPILIEEWLCEQIPSIPLGTGLLTSVVPELATRLTVAVRAARRRLQTAGMPVTVTFSGLFARAPRPMVVCISDQNAFGRVLAAVPRHGAVLWPITPDPRETRTYGDFSVNAAYPTDPEIPLLVHGDVDGFDPRLCGEVLRRLAALTERGASPATFRDYLVTALRQAARQARYATISQDCWSNILKIGDPIGNWDSHFIRERSVTIQPRVVGPNGFRMEMWINQAVEEPEVLNYEARLRSGEWDFDLDEHSLRAYLRASPRVQEWVEFVESLGVEVGQANRLDDVLKMARRCNVRSTVAIDSLLDQSQGWGQEFVKGYFDESHKVHEAMMPDLHGRAPLRSSIDRQTIISLLLVGNWPDILTDNVLVADYSWGLPHLTTLPAKRFNPRFAGSRS